LIQQAWAELGTARGAEGSKPVHPTVGAGLSGPDRRRAHGRPGYGWPL